MSARWRSWRPIRATSCISRSRSRATRPTCRSSPPKAIRSTCIRTIRAISRARWSSRPIRSTTATSAGAIRSRDDRCGVSSRTAARTGIYNATVALLNSTTRTAIRSATKAPKLLRICSPPALECAGGCRPPVWISVVGRSGVAPVRPYVVEDREGYVFALNLGDPAANDSGTRQPPIAPATFPRRCSARSSASSPSRVSSCGASRSAKQRAGTRSGC